MADNVAITAGSGTVIAADDISSVFYQRVKMTWGPDGTANDANLATPLPVSNFQIIGKILDENGNILTVKNAIVEISAASGAQQIVAGVSGKKIRLLGFFLVSDTAVTATFQDDEATPVKLTGGMPLAATGGVGYAAPTGTWIGETTAAADLDLNLGAAATVGGTVVYVEV